MQGVVLRSASKTFCRQHYYWRNSVNKTQRFFAGAAMTVSLIAMAEEPGSNIKVTGWVIDSACAYTKGLSKPIGVACAKACAKNGSPLVILQDDGTIYLPIDSATPSASQNAKLLPYAGEHVTVTGKDYARKGSHALVIDTISR
jgi:hypothetical protein